MGIDRVFSSEQEAAAFWDTHSPEDFPEEFERVEVKFSRPLIKRGLTVKLSEETIDQLRELGLETGVGPSTLVRMWILEHLKGRERHKQALCTGSNPPRSEYPASAGGEHVIRRKQRPSPILP